MAREFIGGRPMFRVWGCGDGAKSSALFELDMAARMAVVVWYVGSKGGSLYMTEGYRPVGVPADQYARRESDTASGVSTQWYQWGRYQRWLAGDKSGTPSAAWPGTSRHGEGRAADTNAPTARDMQLRAEGCALVGLVFNVASESWHCEPLRAVPSAIDLAPWLKFVQGVVTPAAPAPTNNPKKELDMPRIYQENDTKEGKVFLLGGGGAGWASPEAFEAAKRMNKAAGLTGPGWTEPIPTPWADITRVSETLQKGSLAAELRNDIRKLAA